MKPIEFNTRENPDLEGQLTYLIKREFYVSYYHFRKFPYYLVGATVLILGIVFLTPSDSLITFKAVSIALLSLMWLISIIFSIPIFFKWYKRNKWKRDSIESAKKNNSNYKIYFDNEKICFEGATFKTELSWDYYTYWTENKNSIFILPKTNLYEAIYYSVSDIGKENYQELKTIVSLKLIKLD